MFIPVSVGKTVVYFPENVIYYKGTAAQGAGIEWQVNLTGYTIRTETYLTFQGV